VSDLEASFDYHWRILGGPLLTPEHVFAPPRKWRMDRAHCESRTCIELDGGTYSGGRHTTGNGYAKDCEKLNAATALGWAVFRLTSDMLRDAPAQHLAPIIATIENRLEIFDIYGRP
jgi:very-short-patch-repair endonuclease